MKRVDRLAFAAAVLAVFLGTTETRADVQMIGNDFSTGMLYDVNASTGAATNPRNTGLTLLDGITTRTTDGTVFGLTNAGNLYTINAATGVPTFVGATGFNFIEADIAYNPVSGLLYGIQATTVNSFYNLISINQTTGAGTLIGVINGPGYTPSDISAGAFDANGNFYLLDTGNSHLVKVNPTTAAVTSVVSTNVGLGTTAGLAFNPSTGVAYVADGSAVGDPAGTNKLYTLNTATGALTVVGSTGLSRGLGGLTFVSTVPEPGTFALGSIGLVALALARKHRQARTGRTRASA